MVNCQVLNDQCQKVILNSSGDGSATEFKHRIIPSVSMALARQRNIKLPKVRVRTPLLQDDFIPGRTERYPAKFVL